MSIGISLVTGLIRIFGLFLYWRANSYLKYMEVYWFGRVVLIFLIFLRILEIEEMNQTGIRAPLPSLSSDEVVDSDRQTYHHNELRDPATRRHNSDTNIKLKRRDDRDVPLTVKGTPNPFDFT